MLTTKVIGPPGCGKTTKGRGIVSEKIEQGYDPDSIIYTSLTNAAVDEARRKIAAVIGLKGIPEYFATEHSICKRMLGIPSEKIFANKWVRMFSEAYPKYAMSSEVKTEDRFTEGMMQTSGDCYEFAYNYMKSTMLPYEEAYTRVLPGFPTDKIQLTLADFEAYLQVRDDFQKQNDLFSFSDMIELALRRKLVPSAKILCVDEAQDCSPLQWELIKMWMREMDYTYIIGDFLQSVYGFIGSNPHQFLSFPADEEITLAQSYRLPKLIKDFAVRTIKQRTGLPVPEFSAKDEDGLLDWASYYDIRWDNLPECFVLERTRHLISRTRDDLMKMGVPFKCERGIDSPLYKTIGTAYKSALKLKDGFTVNQYELLDLIKHITKPYLKHGAKAKVKRLPVGSYKRDDLEAIGFTDKFFNSLADPEQLDEMISFGDFNDEDKPYLRKVFDKYGTSPDGDITLTTLHGSKGRERKLILLNPDYTPRTFEGLRLEPTSEAMLQYVAITRAKEALLVFRPRGYMTYPMVDMKEEANAK